MASTQQTELSSLRDAQREMARYLRDPQSESAPAGIEPRRLQIYEELVYNNIESFLTSGFPVLYSLYEEDDWRALVRSFMQDHRCHSPYFLEISQEFLQFLLQDHQMRPCDPPFLTELAHYEWVELALDVSEETLPSSPAVRNLLDAVPHLSPLAWSLGYQYPVHRIGRASGWPSPAPTYLVVYRDPDDKVRFMEVNAGSARLLERVRDNDAQTLREILHGLAAEMGAEPQAIETFGLEQVEQFVAASVLWFSD
ncbi:MAG: DUF2063 domain-containing protein [Halioglobus sp.]